MACRGLGNKSARVLEKKYSLVKVQSIASLEKFTYRHKSATQCTLEVGGPSSQVTPPRAKVLYLYSPNPEHLDIPSRGTLWIRV